ncbi:MAG TPA: chemotaxis protein CheD [Candidatus Lokiarchaeia archaeon]|nr:chemotaxis protein CheD [Candidatus Lokiarchaeia archaeon]
MGNTSGIDETKEFSVAMGHCEIANGKAGRRPRFSIYGLGSCIALILFDKNSKTCGMSHILSPSCKSKHGQRDDLPHKYADQSVPALVKNLLSKGAIFDYIKAIIVGGANVIGGSGLMPVGTENIAIVKKTLDELGIPLIKEDVGGNKGRGVIFDTSNMSVSVKVTGEANYRKIYELKD